MQAPVYASDSAARRKKGSGRIPFQSSNSAWKQQLMMLGFINASAIIWLVLSYKSLAATGTSHAHKRLDTDGLQLSQARAKA
jgi:hypothetical protein